MSVQTPAHPAFVQMVQASFAAQGLMTTLGASLTAVEPGTIEIEVPFHKGLSQQKGFFHGGVVGAIADSAGGYAALTLMAQGFEVVTVEYKINFLRPALGDRLLARGSVLRHGQRLTIAEAKVTCRNQGKERLVATSLQTLAPVPPETTAVDPRTTTQ
ncbi:MAG: PaaI family thioesterase [Geminicoccaceae bacterium]